MESGKINVVIIGGGFGGLTVARALANAPVQITLIDRSNHHLFQPLLYQVATAGLSPANIATPIRAVLRSQENTEVMMAEVIGINKEARKVHLHNNEVPYDYLIIATGSWHSYFGHPEWSHFAPGLKSITDATDIRKRILLKFESAEMERDPEKRKAYLTFILVGAGPTGVEMAGSIAELAKNSLAADFRHIDPKSTRIILIEAGDRILRGFPESLARKAEKKLKRLGVEILNSARVEHLDADGVVVGGNRIFGKTVIWCAGVIASPAGKWLNAEMDRVGRVKVDPYLNLPGHPEIFTIGDTASVIQNGEQLPGVAPVAMQQGRYVAALIQKRIEGKNKTRPFYYRDKGSLATIGRSFAIAEFGKFKLSGILGWVVWVVVHIYYLIGFRNRVLVLIEWAWAYLTFQRGARLITRADDDSPDL